MKDLLRRQLPAVGLQVVNADPPIDENSPPLDEVREAVAKVRGEKGCWALVT